MKKGLFNYYQDIKNDQIILVFKGAMTQEVLSDLAGLVKLRFSVSEEHMVMRRLFGILVEMAQNVLHYSSERESLPHTGRDAGVGVIMVRSTDEVYVVSSGNMIHSRAASLLISKCEEVNSLNKQDLKELYLNRRRKLPDEDSKGAGLGFIDLARKCSQPLEYSLMPIDEEHSFFSLSVTLEKCPSLALRR